MTSNCEHLFWWRNVVWKCVNFICCKIKFHGITRIHARMMLNGLIRVSDSVKLNECTVTVINFIFANPTQYLRYSFLLISKYVRDLIFLLTGFKDVALPSFDRCANIFFS